MLIGGLGTPEIIIIAIVILLLFGGKKIPELMKGVGKGIRSFKKGLNEEDGEKDESSSDGEKA
jgi:sec-independent protein translocase protein TatA